MTEIEKSFKRVISRSKNKACKSLPTYAKFQLKPTGLLSGPESSCLEGTMPRSMPRLPELSVE